MNNWNMKDYTYYIQYKKQKGDTMMPTTLTLLKERCINVSGRQSPDCPVHDSDDDADDHFDEEVEFFGEQDAGTEQMFFGNQAVEI
jgi:hypothetical protein